MVPRAQDGKVWSDLLLMWHRRKVKSARAEPVPCDWSQMMALWAIFTAFLCKLQFGLLSCDYNLTRLRVLFSVLFP